MRGFWNKFGHKVLSKITQGTIEVVYKDGTHHTYGSSTPKVKMLMHTNGSVFRRLLMYGDIGFAESFMDKDFDVDDLTGLIKIALLNSKALGTKSEDEKNQLTNLLPQFNKAKHLMRKNSKTRARKNIAQHYDLSNDFFKLFLDDTMMYSSALFKDKDTTLFEAQKYKIAHLGRKLRLKEGMHVLEIGSGWGAMALHIAKTYGCKVTTLTLSVEQKQYCEALFAQEGVDKLIDVKLQDYRDTTGAFDAIISVEMFEAVGKEYFKSYFQTCQKVLKPSGVLVMQVITLPDQRYKSYSKSTDFIQKYIFPGGHLPSVHKILSTTARYTRLNLLELEDFSEDYAKTLNVWYEAFDKQRDAVEALGFDGHFMRMWQMYLNYCEAGFVTRNINLVQLTFSADANTNLNKGLL